LCQAGRWCSRSMRWSDIHWCRARLRSTAGATRAAVLSNVSLQRTFGPGAAMAWRLARMDGVLLSRRCSRMPAIDSEGAWMFDRGGAPLVRVLSRSVPVAQGLDDADGVRCTRKRRAHPAASGYPDAPVAARLRRHMNVKYLHLHAHRGPGEVVITRRPAPTPRCCRTDGLSVLLSCGCQSPSLAPPLPRVTTEGARHLRDHRRRLFGHRRITPGDGVADVGQSWSRRPCRKPVLPKSLPGSHAWRWEAAGGLQSSAWDTAQCASRRAAQLIAAGGQTSKPPSCCRFRPALQRHHRAVVGVDPKVGQSCYA